jgi:hypothetical protein
MSIPQQPSYTAPGPAPETRTYGAPTGQATPSGPFAPLASFNAFALVAIITVCLSPLLGLVLGHIGLSKIKRTGEAGRGFAITAICIGYVAVAGIVLYVIFAAVWLSLLIGMVGRFTTYGYGY